MKSSFYGARGLELVRGQGLHVYTEDGTRYLDATSMFGTTLLGHAHPRVNAAIARQTDSLIACTASWSNPARDALVRRLSALIPWAKDIFLANSGTEAVEAALKASRLTTGRPRIVALKQGFHGRTLGALTATWKPAYREPFAPLAGAATHVTPGNLAELNEALTEDVAAFVFEPIQGEGGVRPVDADFLRAAAGFCAERGILMIADEIQTGCGRTGSFLATEGIVEPDIVCLAKGLANGVPIGATLFGPRVAGWKAGHHGSTFGGNPLACAAAVATLDALEDESWMTWAAAEGSRWREEFRERELPQVREVRGRGLITGIELRGRAAPVVRAAQERGLLVLAAGVNIVRLLPALSISGPEHDEVAEILAAAITTSTAGVAGASR